MAYDNIDVQEMSPSCGAIIEGIDLSQDLTNRQFDEIHEALLDRTVIVFRDQNLTPEQQVAFARRFGEASAFRCVRFREEQGQSRNRHSGI